MMDEILGTMRGEDLNKWKKNEELGLDNILNIQADVDQLMSLLTNELSL